MAGVTVIRCFSVLVHSKASIADRIVGREFFWAFCIALVQWDLGIFLVDILYQVIDCFHIAALIAQKSTLPKGKNIVGSGEYFLINGRIRRIGGSG